MSQLKRRLYIASLVGVGLMACLGALYVAEVDDAPGAGLIGLAFLAGSLVLAYYAAKSEPV